MGRHTPAMSDTELAVYLEEHLATELQWLLRAATEWHVQDTLKLGIEGYEVQVFAMDSAFLHARTLLEFLTKCTSDNYYGCDAFGISRLESQRYGGAWEEHLHAALMHAQDRSETTMLLGFDGQSRKRLDQMPVDFAKEVVRLWREFAVALGDHDRPTISRLQGVAEKSLEDAIVNADRVANSKVTTAHADGKPISKIRWQGQA
ncbi:MAG: hypothetical protein U1F44_03680 [Coriobacteriia bacterium]|nr:hypothetical protein [Coriobacteriia bacterium]